MTPAPGPDAWANHKRMLREDAEYCREYEALEEEFSLVEEKIRARLNSMAPREQE